MKILILISLLLAVGCMGPSLPELKQDEYFLGELSIPMGYEEVLTSQLTRHETCGDVPRFDEFQRSAIDPSKAFFVLHAPFTETYMELEDEGETTVFRIWNAGPYDFITRDLLDESLVEKLENPTDC